MAEFAAPPPEELLTLESESLRVSMWPRMGGKITSLITRGHGNAGVKEDRELLHPPIHPYTSATSTSGFELSDAGGWDECLPSVASCTANNTNIPDHGDVWRTPWQAHIKNDAIHAYTHAASLPLRFSRFLSLDGPTVHLRYSVANTSNRPVDFLYSAHPLFQVEQGDRIVLPTSVHRVHVQGSTIPELAQQDGTCTWPIVELPGRLPLDLSLIRPPDGTTSHKLFAGPIDPGWCGIYRTNLKLGIVIRFDQGQTPYAGLWISHAAWPSEIPGPKQFTVALEPTTAPCDGLDRALALGEATHLLPQAEYSWPLQLEVHGSHQPVTYDQFLHLIATPPRH